ERAAILPTATPFVVREYAHKHLPAVDNVRRDFTETLYWHPVLVVPGGKKTDLTFELSDSVTRFQVQVWAHTLDGRLGSATAEVTSKLPFSVEPTMPFEVTRSDKITIPVIVANRTQKSLSVELGVDAKNLTLQGDAKRQLAVDAGKSVRQLFTFQPSVVEGEATLNVVGRSEPLGADRVERRFKIVPEGFPVVGAKSDLLETVARHEIVLPEDWVKGTLKMQVQVFPSTLADLQKGLEGLLREPGGCFEQSSSSNYPNVLILNYLKASEQTDPQIEKRARTLLTSGYQQLTSFECQVPNQAQVRRGYEWFGQTAPPHEALTAYGLLQFKDMAKVHPVDAAMVERTRKYLLDQRDGKGGFKRNQRALDTFGRAPEHVTNAYIVWSLTEAGGDEDLTVELKTLHEAAKSSKDPYFVALVGLAHLNRGKSDEGLALLKAMRTAQQADGRLTGAQMSITGSGGRDLDIETTALATLAWLRANRPADFNENVQKAAKWIGQQRGGYGGFGSTQSTILALKALIAFTHDNKKVPVDSELVLEVNGKRVSKKFAAGSRDELVLALPDGAVLKPGKNVVSVSMEKNALPYTLTWSYRTLKPANVDNPLVQLTTSLDRNNAVEGETVRLKAVVTNTSGKGQGMAVAILGLPGGLEVPAGFRQLKNMASLQEDGTKPGEISAFEVRSNGRELVLYWRDLAPDKRIEVNVDLVCRQPGEYRGPASRAYLYYNADHKFWVEPLNVTIAPKAE
ncbi:MAG TPA: alpha-2-macroglobulin family protein, partial [Gemmataceae bacterium]|nr:alpha-2-macroglobulin family protein [Gemmataceae bacterium]